MSYSNQERAIGFMFDTGEKCEIPPSSKVTLWKHHLSDEQVQKSLDHAQTKEAWLIWSGEGVTFEEKLQVLKNPYQYYSFYPKFLINNATLVEYKIENGSKLHLWVDISSFEALKKR